MVELLNTLFVTTPGTTLRLDGDAVRIVHPDRAGRHLLPLVRLDHVVAWNGVTLTDDLLHRCAADGRSITWVTRNGRFLARVGGPQGGNPALRLAQYRAHDQPEHRLDLAKRFVAGKLHNYRQLVLRAARDQKGERQTGLRFVAERHALAIDELREAESLTEALGIEGRAAREYFHALDLLSPYATPRRVRRPATDLVNCLLSFGYGMLRVSVHGALEHVGLDPYIGYLHGVRPNKPSLALDLMEELRPLLVDRLVMTVVNRGRLNGSHVTTLPGGTVELTETGQRTFLEEWSKSRQREWPHAGLGRGIPAALLPIVQARLLVRHLRGDDHGYVPWTVN